MSPFKIHQTQQTLTISYEIIQTKNKNVKLNKNSNFSV